MKMANDVNGTASDICDEDRENAGESDDNDGVDDADDTVCSYHRVHGG